MRRRDLLALFGAAAAASSAPGARLNAQQRSQPRLVGVFGSRTAVPAEADAFHQAMSDFGWVEGLNVAYAYRAGPAYGPLPELALELVRRQPEVIVSSAGGAGVRAVMAATSTIPIVMVTASDAVENGLVTSLARPGGNVTGLSQQSKDLNTKRLQLIHETLPLLRRIAVFVAPTTPQSERDAIEAAGRTLGLELRFVEISGPDTFDGAFETAANWGAEALSGATGFVTSNREKFLALAARHRLPAMYHQSIIVHAGGLMSYGANFPDLFRRAAGYADKILKGAKPGDLPVEQPTKFEFVVNLKAAEALGLKLPHALLGRADEIIE